MKENEREYMFFTFVQSTLGSLHAVEFLIRVFCFCIFYYLIVRTYTQLSLLTKYLKVRSGSVPQSLMVWQEDLLAVLEKQPDAREIHYIYENVGCTRKSAFCLFMTGKVDSVKSYLSFLNC